MKNPEEPLKHKAPNECSWPDCHSIYAIPCDKCGALRCRNHSAFIDHLTICNTHLSI